MQVNPKEGDPLCWNSADLTYKCTVEAAQLIWGYTGVGVEPRPYFSSDTPLIGVKFSLGPFDVTLASIESESGTYVMVSTATIRNELTDAIDGQSISCTGTQEELRTIIFVGKLY